MSSLEAIQLTCLLSRIRTPRDGRHRYFVLYPFQELKYFSSENSTKSRLGFDFFL